MQVIRDFGHTNLSFVIFCLNILVYFRKNSLIPNRKVFKELNAKKNCNHQFWFLFSCSLKVVTGIHIVRGA